jgi:hypothetical protein
VKTWEEIRAAAGLDDEAVAERRAELDGQGHTRAGRERLDISTRTGSQMKIVTGSQVPLLGWLPGSPPAALGTPHPPANRDKPGVLDKPSGGLWTSPLIPARADRKVPRRAETAWTRHRACHGARDAGLTVLELAATARLAVVDCLADLRTLPFRPGDRYQTLAREPESDGVDWEALTMACDGLWLTRRGVLATRQSMSGLACWDCETVWLARSVWSVRASGVPIRAQP